MMITDVEFIQSKAGMSLKTLLNIMNPIGEKKTFFKYKDRIAEGLLIFAYDNAVSQEEYSDLFAEVGHSFNQAHVDAGFTDYSDNVEGKFYPTPPPDAYGRVGIPDIGFDSSAIDITGNYINAETWITPVSLRVGTAFKFKAVDGSLPTTSPQINENDAYYVLASGTPGRFFLFTTEQDAIDSSSPIAFTTQGSGTFCLTQEGIRIEDAQTKATGTTSVDTHNHEIYTQGVASQYATGSNIGRVSGGYAGSSGGTQLDSNAIRGDSHTHSFIAQPDKESNETRPKTFVEFSYIRATNVL